MTIIITWPWWVFPAIISAVALLWMIFWPARGMGIDKLFGAVLWLIVALSAWAIAGALK